MRVGGLQLDGAVSKQPGEHTIRVLLFEPEVKAVDASLQLGRQLACWLIHLRPGAISENLSVKFNPFQIAARRLNVGQKFVLHFTRQLHVLKHLFHHVDLVRTALYLQFLDKDLLVLLGDGSLVEEAGAEFLGILLDEDIASMQAAEEIDDGIESLVHVQV